VCFLSPAAWRNLACIRVDRSGNTRPACIHTVCTDRLVVELSDSNLLPTGTVPRAQHWLAGSTNEQSKRRPNGSTGCRSSRTGQDGQPSRSRESPPYRWPNMSLDDSAVQRRSLRLVSRSSVGCGHRKRPGNPRRGRDAGSGRSACSDHVSGLGFARATPCSQASHADAPVSATQQRPTRPRESEAARAPTSPDQAQAGTHGRAGLVRACARLRRSCFLRLTKARQAIS
jgi:hypothetical protein